MASKIDNSSARRVVESPKGSPIPYFVVATVVAVSFWSWQQQPATEDVTSSRSTPKAETERASVPHGAKGELRTLFSADDYPADATAKGEQGTVQAELAVSATGQVTDCNIIRSSGSGSLDSRTCRVLRLRARFIPAQDVDGKPVSDRVTTPPIVWRLED